MDVPKQLHVSLTVRANAISVVATGVVAATLTVAFRPTPWLVLVIACVCGALAGLLQTAALRKAPQAFLDASTSLAVRSALVSTVPGSWAIRLQWLMLPVLLAVWLLGGVRPIVAPLAAFAAFMSVRDLVALPAVASLSTESRRRAA